MGNETVETIYFGGGTPSLLSQQEISLVLNALRQNFEVNPHSEITLEANPDDLTNTKLKDLKSAGINRLSIGIQSFNDQMLKYFNRAHNAEMALDSVRAAQALGINNISIDLIFGAPNQSTEDLKKDLDQALSLKTPHISIYGLTIEKDTVFGKWAKTDKLIPLDDDIAAEHLEVIMSTLAETGYTQYEISNFCTPDFESRHNSSYWHGKKYLGLGPAAHSFNGTERAYNQAHNTKYIQQLQSNTLPSTVESLSREDHINEIILTQLRLKEGINMARLRELHAFDLITQRRAQISEFENMKMLESSQDFLRLTSKGKLLADFITEKLII